MGTLPIFALRSSLALVSQLPSHLHVSASSIVVVEVIVVVELIVVVYRSVCDQGHSTCRVCTCTCRRTCTFQFSQSIRRSPLQLRAPPEETQGQEEAVVRQPSATGGAGASWTPPSMPQAKPLEAA